MALHVVMRSGDHEPDPKRDVRRLPSTTPSALGPDPLFSMIDSRELVVLGRKWRAEVFSVTNVGELRYVQLALRGEMDRFLTLRVLPKAPTTAALTGLLNWIAQPGPNGSVVDVA